MAHKTPDNVRLFRPRQVEAPPKGRLFGIIFPLAVAYYLYTAPLGGDGLTLFLALGLIYWVFIRRHAIETSFFTRSHYLHTTMGLLLWYGLCLIVLMVINFLLATAGLTGATVMNEPLFIIQSLISLVYRYGAVAYGLAQATYAALGKTPQFPIVTRNVDSWA